MSVALKQVEAKKLNNLYVKLGLAPLSDEEIIYYSIYYTLVIIIGPYSLQDFCHRMRILFQVCFYEIEKFSTSFDSSHPLPLSKSSALNF